MKKIVLASASVLDPGLNLEGERDILLSGEKIEAVGKPGEFSKVDADRIDLKGKLITPGLIDIHVHLREPGFEWKETVATGADAAAAGGFTAVCCMPNTNPINDTAQVTEFILKQAAAAGKSRVYPIGAISKGQKGESLAPLLELHEAGCVAYSDDGHPVMDGNIMRKALEYSKMFGGVLTVHEEDINLSRSFAMHEGQVSFELGLKGFPGQAEEVMIARDIELARLTGGRVHFCHITTARGAKLVERAKEDGIPVTGEVTPHHFTLTDEACRGYNTQAKCSPPLRTEADVEGLLLALEKGIIDCIATDHAPHEADSKNREFQAASNGMLGLQTALPLTLAKVRAGKLSLKRAIESLTVSPAKCFGLMPNRLQAGAIADITVIDLHRKVTVTESWFRSRSKNSPFIGHELQGMAVMTFVGGKKVFEQGEEA